MKKLLKKCSYLATIPIEDSRRFGPQEIMDPDTGDFIKYEGYSEEKNQDLLIYINKVYTSGILLYNCIDDLIFFETLLSAENFPVFNGLTQNTQYLNLTYQHWLIKSITCFDCVLHALNSTYELGLPAKSVRNDTVMENDNIIVNEKNFNLLRNLDKILTKTCRNFNKLKRKETNRSIRNKIIHYNDFEHDSISSLDFEGFCIELKMLDINEENYQANIGRLSVKLMEEVKKINHEIMENVYPLFEYLNLEYKGRFDEKLIQ